MPAEIFRSFGSQLLTQQWQRRYFATAMTKTVIVAPLTVRKRGTPKPRVAMTAEVRQVRMPGCPAEGDALLDDRDEVMAEHSNEGQEEFAFVDAIWHTIGSEQFRAGDLLERINGNKLLAELIPASLSKKFSGSGSNAGASVFGHWLKARRGTTFGIENTIQLDRGEALSQNGSAIWQFVRL